MVAMIRTIVLEILMLAATCQGFSIHIKQVNLKDLKASERKTVSHIGRPRAPPQVTKEQIEKYAGLPFLDHEHDSDHDHKAVPINAEKLLIENLLQTYKTNGRYGRPIRQMNKTLLVGYGISLIQIMNVDAKEQVLTTNVWCKYKWRDELLQWDPLQHGNITVVRVPINDIWKPDFVLYNYADERMSEHRDAMAVILPNGVVQYIPPAIFKSSCAVDTTNFPFDEQSCHMKFGSWTYNGRALDPYFNEGKDFIELNNYVPSQEWVILEHRAKKNIQFYDCCPNDPYPDLTFFLKLRRRATFYSYTLILPCVLLSFITMVLFMLPPETPAKMLLGINIYIAFFMLLLLLNESTPPTAIRIPILGAYYCFNMVMTTVSTFFCAILVDMHFRADKRHPPCSFLTSLVILVTARAMLMHIPQNIQDFLEEQNKRHFLAKKGISPKVHAYRPSKKTMTVVRLKGDGTVVDKVDGTVVDEESQCKQCALSDKCDTSQCKECAMSEHCGSTTHETQDECPMIKRDSYVSATLSENSLSPSSCCSSCNIASEDTVMNLSQPNLLNAKYGNRMRLCEHQPSSLGTSGLAVNFNGPWNRFAGLLRYLRYRVSSISNLSALPSDMSQKESFTKSSPMNRAVFVGATFERRRPPTKRFTLNDRMVEDICQFPGDVDFTNIESWENLKNYTFTRKGRLVPSTSFDRRHYNKFKISSSTNSMTSREENILKTERMKRRVSTLEKLDEQIKLLNHAAAKLASEGHSPVAPTQNRMSSAGDRPRSFSYGTKPNRQPSLQKRPASCKSSPVMSDYPQKEMSSKKLYNSPESSFGSLLDEDKVAAMMAAPATLENEMHLIRNILKKFHKRLAEKEQTKRTAEVWRFISMVFDRIFLFGYILAMIISLTVIFPQRPPELSGESRYPNGTVIPS